MLSSIPTLYDHSADLFFNFLLFKLILLLCIIVYNSDVICHIPVEIVFAVRDTFHDEFVIYLVASLFQNVTRRKSSHSSSNYDNGLRFCSFRKSIAHYVCVPFIIHVLIWSWNLVRDAFAHCCCYLCKHDDFTKLLTTLKKSCNESLLRYVGILWKQSLLNLKPA